MYDDFPIEYIVLDADQATPLVVQELYIKLARENGVKVHEHHFTTGHSPYLGHPELLTSHVAAIDFQPSIDFERLICERCLSWQKIQKSIHANFRR